MQLLELHSVSDKRSVNQSISQSISKVMINMWIKNWQVTSYKLPYHDTELKRIKERNKTGAVPSLWRQSALLIFSLHAKGDDDDDENDVAYLKLVVRCKCKANSLEWPYTSIGIRIILVTASRAATTTSCCRQLICHHRNYMPVPFVLCSILNDETRCCES